MKFTLYFIHLINKDPIREYLF